MQPTMAEQKNYVLGVDFEYELFYTWKLHLRFS